MGRIIKKQSLIRKLEKIQIAHKNSGGASQGISSEQIKNLNQDPSRIEVKKNQKRVFSQKHRKLAKRGAAVSRGSWQQPTKSPTWTIYPTPAWFASQSSIDVSIVVPLYKSRSVITDQINSWDLSQDSLTKEIIYVSDGCPEKSYLAVLAAWEKRKRHLQGQKVGKIVIHNQNGGFGTACNTGAKNATGKYIIFLNADCTVTRNWVEPMVARIKSNPSIGIVGNLQLKDNDIIDSAGSYWTGSSFEHIGKTVYKGKRTRPMRWQSAPSDLKTAGERQMVTGCCFIMPRHLFLSVGGFDPEYLVGYWEDADLNMKVRTIGHKVFYEPKSKIYHSGQHSRCGGHRFQGVNRAKFKKDWVDSGVLKLLNDDLGKPKVDTSKSKIVVYTAIVNNYDNLSEHQNKKGADFVAFLDNIKTKSNTWEVLSANKTFDDPNRNAKIHKILSHNPIMIIAYG
jgi:GT2 family glycosyltransferase